MGDDVNRDAPRRVGGLRGARGWAVALLVGLVAAARPGCAPKVQVGRLDPPDAAAGLGRAWPAAGVSDASRGWLTAAGLDVEAERSPLALAARLLDTRPGDPAAQLAAAELALAVGLHARGAEAREAGLLLAAAAGTAAVEATAAAGLAATRAGVRAAEAQRLALGGLIAAGPSSAPEGASAAFGPLEVAWTPDDGGDLSWGRGLPDAVGATGPSLRPLGRVRAVVPADALAFRGFHTRHRRGDVGCPVVVRVETGPGDGDLLFYPPGGLSLTATAVAELRRTGGGGGRGVTLRIRLLDPAAHAAVPVAGGTLPLAADFTAAYGLLAGEASLQPDALAQLFNPGAGDDRSGLYLLSPYDPDRTPLVLVHGLKSSPLTWKNVINAVLGEPALRGRYQVCIFYYPTGDPFAVSAARLRDSLREARRTLGPAGEDPGWDNLVVVAHSMGGLLAQTLLKSSRPAADPAGGDPAALFRETIHERTPAELGLPEAERDLLERAFFFDPLPGVGRVVYLVTPLRGTRVADAWFARLGRWVIRPDRAVAGVVNAVLRADPAGLNPFFAGFAGPGLTGVGDLSPDSPLIRALAERPVTPPVPRHVIVGEVRGRWPGGSDGVVPHASSRLPDARSTLVVAGAGHSVLEDPAAVREVQRILRLHAGPSRLEPTAPSPRQGRGSPRMEERMRR